MLLSSWQYHHKTPITSGLTAPQHEQFERMWHSKGAFRSGLCAVLNYYPIGSPGVVGRKVAISICNSDVRDITRLRYGELVIYGP